MELWKRWVEFGAFTSLMRDHLWDNNPGAIKLWTNDSTIAFFKKYAMLHKMIQPYLYSLAIESSKSGVPIIRHMMLEYPTDTSTYNCEYQYMLGSELIIAPVVEEHADTKEVYLPEGEWKYLWDDKMYQGKHWVTVKAPVDEIPVFIKKGSNVL
ncbi:MAG: glycoside hydrolase family 31 protein [Bacteroidota bacterium]|nr:glycoside hydrolase family 31 protein [Bacteroidota bacterium]